jgi:hypothetical protein
LYGTRHDTIVPQKSQESGIVEKKEFPYRAPMRFSTLLALSLALPTVAAAQTICYSPSDCVAPLRCSSLTDGVVPGTCKDPTAQAPVAAPVPKPKPVVPQPKTVVTPPTFTPPASSSSAATSQAASSSASPQDPLTDPGFLDALAKSMAATMQSIMNSMTSMLNSFKCMFGGCN